MAACHLIDVDVARAWLRYDPDTGFIEANRGSVTKSSTGYIVFRIDGRQYAAHRLAWALYHGAQPTGHIDHINGDRTDNRAVNLRDVSRTVNNQNQRVAHRSNRSSGLLGASWHKRDKCWMSHISVCGKKTHLGSFKTAEAAHARYLEAKRVMHEGCTI